MTEEEPALFSRWERDTRYYELRLQQDLWGDWLLTRVWGGKGTALGQIRRELCEHYSDGLLRHKIAEAQREKRGYRLVNRVGQSNLV